MLPTRPLLTAVALLAGGLSGACASSGAGSATAVPILPRLDSARLVQDVARLSHDSMGGRATMTAGNAKARSWLIAEFGRIGLAPVGADFAHPFAMPRRNSTDSIRGVNVLGVVRGTRTSDRVIVVSAHYDHVGTRNGEIHNGADDNASGTASIIEIARAASGQRARFARSLVFVAFAGEERGLLGSAHYVNGPAIPIGDTVAMLNLDMVGRSRGSVDVSGLDDAPSIETDLAAAVAATGQMRIRRQGPGAGRSDDWNFHARRVPAINFFTGFHDDYHRPSDDWDKIDAPGTQHVASLALELAARLAGRPDRPAFVAR